MVYVDPEELKWMPYVTMWLEKWKKAMTPEAPDFIMNLFETYVEEGLQFVTKKCTQAMHQVKSIVLLLIVNSQLVFLHNF